MRLLDGSLQVFNSGRVFVILLVDLYVNIYFIPRAENIYFILRAVNIYFILLGNVE